MPNLQPGPAVVYNEQVHACMKPAFDSRLATAVAVVCQAGISFVMQLLYQQFYI